MKKSDFRIFKNMPELTTQRLRLRKIEISDVDDVFEYASDPAVSEFLLWHPHEKREYTKSYICYLERLYKKGKFYDWGIEYQGKMIGTVGFTKINKRKNCAEIGYVLNRSFWGKGIGLDAVNALLKYGFCVLKLDKIDAVIMSENKRSEALLLKCNFAHEYSSDNKMLIKGEYRDIRKLSLSKETFFKE